MFYSKYKKIQILNLYVLLKVYIEAQYIYDQKHLFLILYIKIVLIFIILFYFLFLIN